MIYTEINIDIDLIIVSISSLMRTPINIMPSFFKVEIVKKGTPESINITSRKGYNSIKRSLCNDLRKLNRKIYILLVVIKILSNKFLLTRRNGHGSGLFVGVCTY
jgi:hypothetical protein